MTSIDIGMALAVAFGAVRMAEEAIKLSINFFRGKNGNGKDLSSAIHRLAERSEKTHELASEKLSEIAKDQARIADALLRLEQRIDSFYLR